MAQVLQMQAAPELAKAQFEQNMDAATDREPPTPASPDSGEARGRRRDREDSGEDGADGETGGSRKRRRSRKGLDKKFECPHEGCGKSYSRAEHLYRHQLNRTSIGLHLHMLSLDERSRTDAQQTIPSRSTTATSRTAIGTSKLFAVARTILTKQVFRPSRSLCTPQGTPHRTRQPASPQRHLQHA